MAANTLVFKSKLDGWLRFRRRSIRSVITALPHPALTQLLPFAPEQSRRHYAFHLSFAATQLPILSIALPSSELQKILKPANVIRLAYAGVNGTIRFAVIHHSIDE